MKKILYSIFVLLLSTHIAIAQTTLMSDEDHRIMMNDYQVRLDSILNTVIPQGISIDQFKKKIVNGELTLSSATQTNILDYAEPLKAYGTQFATAKNLTAITDAEKIFLSSFAPSTLVDSSGNIVESTTGGLTAVDMWECALSSFDVGDCVINALVSNKTDIKALTKAARELLTQQAGVTGVLVMINGFYDCQLATKITSKSDFIDLINTASSQYNKITDFNRLSNIILKPIDQWTTSDIENLASSLGFVDTEELINYGSVQYKRLKNLEKDHYISKINSMGHKIDNFIDIHNVYIPRKLVTVPIVSTNKSSPKQIYIRALQRCTVTFAVEMTASGIAGVFSFGVGEAIGLAVSMTHYALCRQWAFEDYMDN